MTPPSKWHCCPWLASNPHSPKPSSASPVLELLTSWAFTVFVLFSFLPFSFLVHFPKHHGQLCINSSAFIINCCWCGNVNYFLIWRLNLLQFSREMINQQQNRTIPALKTPFPVAFSLLSAFSLMGLLLPSCHLGLLTYLSHCLPAVFLSFVLFWDNLTLAAKRKEAKQEGRGKERGENAVLQSLWAEIETNLIFGKLTDFKALCAGWSTHIHLWENPRRFFLNQCLRFDLRNSRRKLPPQAFIHFCCLFYPPLRRSHCVAQIGLELLESAKIIDKIPAWLSYTPTPQGFSV